ncbi:hypothetical protein GDO81_016451, partial [Engystomops pustulosus]
MFKSKSGTDKEHQLKPSRRSMPCLAQSQTHPQHLNKQSTVLQQNKVQPQPDSEGSSAIDVEPQQDSTRDTYTDDSEHGTYDCRTDQSLLIQHKLNRQKQASRKSQKCKEDAMNREKQRFPAHTHPNEMTSVASLGLYFKDGIKRIDYILVYKKSSPQIEKRSTFEKNLRAEGLMLERENSITNNDIMFVKVHCPWDTLCKYAERMNIRMPFRKKCYYTDWRSKTMGSLQRNMRQLKSWLPRNPMKLDKEALPDLEETDCYTAPFSRARMHHFTINNKDTFFSNSTRSRIVHHCLQRTKYEDGKSKMGINRLLSNGTMKQRFHLTRGVTRADTNQNP